jgi:6-pyruvoyltetrahydropterin/6-carboxytetrahydropterin synthase
VKASLTRTYRFEAAHRLPRVPPGHKCARMHGHGFVLEVTVAGAVGKRTGWVMDYAEIDAVVRPVVEALDHRTLNDVEGLSNPTSELLAAWIWKRIRKGLPGLVEVAVSESPSSRCAVRGS